MILPELFDDTIVYTPNIKRNTVEIDITDRETGSWRMLIVPFDDLIIYLYDLDSMYWGLENHIKIGIALSRLTDVEYQKTMIGFIRGYHQTHKESVLSELVASVFDLNEFNPLWN